jgi:hypothetical protein
MVGKAFVTRKRFLYFPSITSTRWVGTIKHTVVPMVNDEDGEEEALVMWVVDDSNFEGNKKYGMEQTKNHR